STVVSMSEDQTIRVWDLGSGQERMMLTGQTSTFFGGARRCAVSADASVVITLSSSVVDTVRAWNLRAVFENSTSVRPEGYVFSCAISADGSTMVTAPSDSTLRVWDVRQGAEVLTLVGHDQAVRGCAVSGDGRLTVSASADRALKIWDARSGA